MSKFNITAISDNELKVEFSKDTPIELVAEIYNILNNKGMSEDLSKSTVGERFFIRNKDTADVIIEKLYKMTASKPTKGGPGITEYVNWKELTRPKKKTPNVANIDPPNTSRKPEPNTGTSTETEDSEKLEDLWRYRNKFPGSTWKKQAMGKSDYGKFKGGSQYSTADNVNRKSSNTGDNIGSGPNSNVKAFSTKTGQLSAKQSAATEANKYKKINKKQPVKVYTPEEIKQLEEKRKQLAASLNVDDIYEENLNKHEEDAVNKLTNLMQQKSMLSNLQPSNEDFIAAGENMGIGLPEQELNKAHNNWSNSIQDWLIEASKPISSRFSSKEEEIKYWDSIRIKDSEELE